MSGKESILGAHKDRVKTDVRLSPKLTKQVDIFCKYLGLPKNVFYTVAACSLLIQWGPFLTVKKQRILYEMLSDLVQKVQENLRKLSE